MYKIEIRDETLADLQDAYDWYEEQREALGDEFIKEIEDCFKKLIDNPNYYTFINKKFRRIATKRFPYLIVYRIDKNLIVINSIKHKSRKRIY